MDQKAPNRIFIGESESCQLFFKLATLNYTYSVYPRLEAAMQDKIEVIASEGEQSARNYALDELTLLLADKHNKGYLIIFADFGVDDVSGRMRREVI